MTPALSIIIVNYDCAPDTIACVAALRRSRAVDFEIVVVDNDSPPEDRRLLAGAGLAGVELVLEDRNGGFGTGCNRGARRARGTHLLFVNPDIVVRSPDALAELRAIADATPDLGALGCRVVFSDDRPQPSAHRRYPDLTTHAWDYAPAVSSLMSLLCPGYSPTFFPLARYATDVLPATHLLGAFLLVPRAVFRRAGGFDEGFFLYREETDLCQRIAALGLRVVYVPSPVVVHAAGASTGNRVFANLDARYMESTYRYLRLHHGPAYVRAAWLLALVGMLASLPWALLMRAAKRARGGPGVADFDVLIRLLPRAIGWHLRHVAAVARPVRRQLPAF